MHVYSWHLCRGSELVCRHWRDICLESASMLTHGVSGVPCLRLFVVLKPLSLIDAMALFKPQTHLQWYVNLFSLLQQNATGWIIYKQWKGVVYPHGQCQLKDVLHFKMALGHCVPKRGHRLCSQQMKCWTCPLI